MYLDALEMGLLQDFFVPMWNNRQLVWSRGVSENAGVIFKF